MAIFASLFGALGRFAGKLLNSALGWASLLLYGRVPKRKQIILNLVALGSIAWVVSVIGILVPDIGMLLIAAVPIPKFINHDLVRLAMLVAAVVLPILVGIGSFVLLEPERRPHGIAIAGTLLRGYPYTLLLALTLLFLAGVATIRKVRTLAKRWEDAHVPIVVKPNGYDTLVRDLHDALGDANVHVARRAAPRVLTTPARLLGAVAGPGVKDLVPERLALLTAADVEVLVYPSDISISGSKLLVAEARAAIATRLTHAPAYLTTTAQSQAIEDRITAASKEVAAADRHDQGAANRARGALADVDHRLATLTIDYEEWEVLYRMRLQVERDLLETPEGQEEVRLRGANLPGRAPEPSYGFSLAAAIAGFAVVLLDVVLALVERVSPSSPRR